jgi:hypothetical protein
LRVTLAAAVRHTDPVSQLANGEPVPRMTERRRIYVSEGVRQLILDAYTAANWRSSRHASAAAKAMGLTIAHATIESFLKSRWTTVDRETLRALAILHGIDIREVQSMLADETDPPWTISMPQHLWSVPLSDRARIERAILALVDATPRTDG